ncbi:MAG: ATP-dependent DNA helicase RecG [Lachnospiraceae bacterium]|nr:ATP-dependent DNA helicase RecG [Lachnospiraceae bacterium]
MQIIDVKGIGEKTEKLFHKLGVYTTEELLEFYPRNYDMYEAPTTIRDLDNQSVAAFRCMVISSPVVRQVRKLSILILNVTDENGENITVKWYNMPFLKGKFRIGMHFVFRGRITKNNFRGRDKNQGEIVLEQPEIFSPDEYQKKQGYLSPIYRLTEGLSNKTVTKSVRQVLEHDFSAYEFLPAEIKEQYHLMSYRDAVEKIHFPADYEEMESARKRLAFQEFFLFIMALRRFKEESEVITNQYPIDPSPQTDLFLKQLPFELTGAQKKVVDEMRKDFRGKKAMNRLVQGDVGSGKTIIAIIGLLDTAFAGYQGVLMAPTEVLAVQHYEGICQLFEENHIDIRVELLTGSMSAKEKRKAYERIELGLSKIVIGTHAIIQDSVIYQKLAFVITDEQHRFGVKQREKLAEKGFHPHIMVMSATPIPRTLAIILYGDLDVSVIDELPKGRLPIKNCVVGKEFRPNAYKFMAGEIKKGHQCYVICPMIEENENLEAVDVVSYTDILRENLPEDVSVEYLHGKMRPAIKNDLMERFALNEIQVLVSTTVIEVGVNVPNATVMMVENAERFGLASLHQLRGRVGRGEAQSYCIFVSGSDKPETRERLDILNRSNDGFEIANWDLKLRGPGDFFGIRQSGDMDFKIGDIYSDAETLQCASEAVRYVEEHQYELGAGEMQMLENKLEKYMTNAFKLNL